MNYYQARELKDEFGRGQSLWHYTCQNDGHVYPVGHCSPWETCPECKGMSMLCADRPCDKCQSKGVITKENPCPGHPTPEEAAEHYRQYLLDEARYDLYDLDRQDKCQICGAWTQKAASVGEMGFYHLCDEHLNRESLEQVYGKVHQIISSY